MEKQRRSWIRTARRGAITLTAFGCLTINTAAETPGVETDAPPVATPAEPVAVVAPSSGVEAVASPVPRDLSARTKVFRIPIEGMVDLGMAPFVDRVVKQATAEDGVVLLDISTFGGRVDAAVLIRDKLIDAPVPTVAFVNHRAISAGALMALACETIAIAPGGTIGAATPITIAGGGDGEKPTAADEKMMSYMRTEMRSTAERRGRSSDIAAAMVDPDIAIEGLNAEGKVLTLTTKDALEHGIADFEAANLKSVLQTLGLGGATVVEGEINWAERIARVISDPTISSLLLSIGFLGIMIELYHPGWGLPGTLGVASLLVFFAGHHVVQLAGSEEILLFGLGVLLLMIEAFVIPGFGVTGIAGFGLVAVSVVMSLVGLDLKVSWELGLVREAMSVLTAALVLTVVFGFMAFKVMPSTRFGQRMVLAEALPQGAGLTSEQPVVAATLPLGTVAVVASDLRPAGKIKVEARRIDAVSEGGYIGSGETVEIVAWRGGVPVVRIRPSEPQNSEPQNRVEEA